MTSEKKLREMAKSLVNKKQWMEAGASARFCNLLRWDIERALVSVRNEALEEAANYTRSWNYFQKGISRDRLAKDLLRALQTPEGKEAK